MPKTALERPAHLDVSRRERQILDVLFARERATAAEIQANLPEAPSYSAVRALLRILETKGHVRHEQDGPRYVYVPVVARDSAKRSAPPAGWPGSRPRWRAHAQTARRGSAARGG